MRRTLAILLLSLSVIAHAQHQFEAGVHGGVAGWSADKSYVNSSMGVHAGAHIYYNYLSPYVIGFRTGVTIDCHNAGFGKNGYEDTYSTTDVDGEPMDIIYSVSSLRERYTLWSAAVPLQLAWSYDRFTLYTGAKAVFPLSGSRRQTVSHAALSVYYPNYDNRIDESYPLGASQDFDMNAAGRFEQPKVQWWLALELSYSIPLRIWSRKSRPYVIVGAYFDYGLSNILPDNNKAPSLIMLTDTRDGLPLQRTLTPVMNANRHGSPLVMRCSLFDAGVKVSYAISSYTPPKRKVSSRCNCSR